MAKPLTPEAIDKKLRAKLLPGPAVKAGPRAKAGAKGLFDSFFVNLIVTEFVKWFRERFKATPRAKGEAASRGLSAEALLNDFIDFLTSGLNEPWKGWIGAALKLAAPIILDWLKGHTVEPLA